MTLFACILNRPFDEQAAVLLRWFVVLSLAFLWLPLHISSLPSKGASGQPGAETGYDSLLAQLGKNNLGKGL